MAERFRRLSIALGASALAVPLSAQEPPRPPAAAPAPPMMTAPAEPDMTHPWLDDVRAQRQAWEERRRASKEAMDARRRWIDPWGAAQQEAREKETQRRREARREQIEREREAFRDLPPWGPQPGPWHEDSPVSGLEPPPAEPGADGAKTQKPSPSSRYPLPGWDNRWYYRGY